ncbi:related to glycosyl hydrolase [Rhynchosporium secalis]|uniref:Related to glycosyl hydrolase n=1 Tax=Rhynchosporium secalis TaxID=38038 RepID=A0A1E1MK24_RHYSE|nr:related to glycosyl hydrolase [Rhynchosporium secalis]
MLLSIRQVPLILLWALHELSLVSGSAFRFSDQQSILNLQNEQQEPIRNEPNHPKALPALLDALDVLQDEYFAIWQGIWPSSIDWTSAVIGTYLSASLSTISTSFSSLSSPKDAENILNKYFSHLSASYFGQDAFALRQEAYDDMLWVVLGWLESIKFINTHSEAHYNKSATSGWYGEQWTPAFAHRAHLFWDIASQGWDTSLCDGGMIWSPYLTPYKNAITNELWIAASISMYLYFPGDDNTSPFGVPGVRDGVAKPHDPKYLAAAIEAYKWLNESNMTDAMGLYVDGYHISGWSIRKQKSGLKPNTTCDERNEMVYSYNQGVLLSGQRGLYEATGARSYLEEGHQLIKNVIAATGWNLEYHNIFPEENSHGPKLGKWHGLGRSGIMEESCDEEAYCSQDGQTFKGIFFHHLTLFCALLPEHLVLPSELYLTKEVPSNPKEVKGWHDKMCLRYGNWIEHNAKAALSTLDADGKFGMWWGAPAHSEHEHKPDIEVGIPGHAVDYRNNGIPQLWKEKKGSGRDVGRKRVVKTDDRGMRIRDLNDRGRGRTVETQGGGVMVLRALWELVETR